MIKNDCSISLAHFPEIFQFYTRYMIWTSTFCIWVYKVGLKVSNLIEKYLYFFDGSQCMVRSNSMNSNNLFMSGVIIILVILILGNSIHRETFAALPGEKPHFDCTYNSDKNKDTCCDSSDNNIKCIECDVDFEIDQRYNCKQVSAKSDYSSPTDIKMAPQHLNKPSQNLSESESESES